MGIIMILRIILHIIIVFSYATLEQWRLIPNIKPPSDPLMFNLNGLFSDGWTT